MQYTTLYTTLTHRLQPLDLGHMKDTGVNRCLKMGGFACSTDCLPNAGPTSSTCGLMLCQHSSHPLGVQIVCLGYLWILRNVDKKYFFKSENFEKIEIIICGIHCFIQNKIAKLIIPRSPFNLYFYFRSDEGI